MPAGQYRGRAPASRTDNRLARFEYLQGCSSGLFLQGIFERGGFCGVVCVRESLAEAGNRLMQMQLQQ